MSIDATFVTESVALAAEVEDRTAQIETYIYDHDIDMRWAAEVTASRKAAGLPHPRPWQMECRVPGVSYHLDLTGEGLLLTGNTRDGEEHAYYLPVEFLFEETRETAVARLRDKHQAQAEKARLTDEARAEQEREQKETQFERLGRELGRL